MSHLNNMRDNGETTVIMSKNSTQPVYGLNQAQPLYQPANQPMSQPFYPQPMYQQLPFSICPHAQQDPIIIHH